MSIYTGAEKELKTLDDNALFRKRKIIDGAQDTVIDIDGQPLLNFSSNDYLGLANDPRIKQWFKEAIEQYGTGAGSSQLIVGHSIAHHQLEQAVAKFLKRDRAVIFSSGYLANLAIASALIDKSTIILQDKLNHASLVDAAKLSSGRLLRYPHADVDRLKQLMEKHKSQNLLVMTDGVFSMDGDTAKLSQIAELCQHYQALLIVDDAHGLGVLGENGGGLLETLSLNQQQVPLLIGTFGKAFGMSGAFVSGEARLIELFIQKARTYIYTTALPAATAATLIKVVDLVNSARDLRQQLFENVKHFKKDSAQISYSETHIQPVVIGESIQTLAVSDKLYNNGILAMPIRPPTVPAGTARLRISLSAKHTTDQIKQFCLQLNEAIS